jgi:hydrogenase assembly chaperone HypC/HupF
MPCCCSAEHFAAVILALSTHDYEALVRQDGLETVVDISLVEDVRAGDHLIVHAGYAIEILDSAEAAERLKLLDEREAELEVKARLLKGKGNGKSLFPDQASRYRWSNWRFKSGKDLRDFVGGEVFPYMASLLKEEPLVAIYFQDAKLDAGARAVAGSHTTENDRCQRQ